MNPPLLFATHNSGKLREVREILGEWIPIRGLDEEGIHLEIPEPHLTLEQNASEKCRGIHEGTGRDCFAEDTGLFVSSLDGDPGVRSARYAGPSCNSRDNIRKLLQELKGCSLRQARFSTVIVLYWKGKEYQFEGSVEGKIAEEPRGEGGFGYDPVFLPDGGEGRTFAQMSTNEKNRFSHRAIAFEHLKQFLLKCPD